jgi:hypothetical protein
MKKKILLTKAAIAPYDVYLFNRLSDYFDINILFFEKVESYRKWEWAQKNIQFNYFFAETKQLKFLGKTLNISKIPSNIDLKNFDEIIVETDTKNLLNNIFLLKKAEKLNKVIGCKITVYRRYKVFHNSVFYGPLNFFINLLIKRYFVKNNKIKKYIGYGEEFHSLVEDDRPFLHPGYYYPLKEEYGDISIDDVKFFNINRFNDMNKVKLLVISYLNPRKNIDFVINQVNKLNNFELHIIGDGESKYVDYLKSISGKNIFFHGLKFGSDKKDFLIKSDFLIFHTLKDVWGLVVHEAMYFGLPVIASKNVPSARQILKHCKCGFIYNNESEFLRILHYINEEMSKEEYNEMSLKAKIFMDKFNEEAYENWKKFLET